MSFIDLQITNLSLVQFISSLKSPQSLSLITGPMAWDTSATGTTELVIRVVNVHSQPHHSHLHSRHLERSINHQVVKKIIRGETFSYEILSIYFWYWVLSSVIEKGMINQSSTFPMSSGKIISIFILLCFWLECQPLN